MIYLLMAWRNIWRNRRRTWITIASIFFAVILSTLMWAILEGVYTNMVRNVVAFSTGYLQVHAKGYQENRNLDYVFKAEPSLVQRIRTTEGVSHIAPRIEQFVFASSGSQTSGALLMGVDPALENSITSLASKVAQGTYLQQDDKGIMIGAGLAKKLRLGIGDTIVVISQGYQGAAANALFRIKAILQMGSPDLDKLVLYTSLPAMSDLLSLNGQLTAWAIMIPGQDDLEPVKKKVAALLDTTSFEVLDWKEMIPELDQMIEADSSGHKITLMILYLVTSFGIFSTILMMLAERRHEFGILLAIGTKRRQLAFMIFLETLFISMIGVITGTLASFPVIYYYAKHPYQLKGELKEVYESYGFEAIIPASTELSVFLSQARIVFIITLVISLYPVFKIFRLKLMNAIRS